MMMSMAIQDVYGRYMMFKDWPRGAALWWRRIPTATSGRAVRESDRMLLGSAHAVPTHEDVHKMCSHVPSGTAGTSRRRSSYTPGTPSRRARVSADAAVVVAAAAASACGGPAAAASLGRKVARTPPRRTGSQKCWRRIPTETRERSVRESDIDWVFTRRSETLWLCQRRILIESAQQCIQI